MNNTMLLTGRHFLYGVATIACVMIGAEVARAEGRDDRLARECEVDEGAILVPRSDGAVECCYEGFWCITCWENVCAYECRSNLCCDTFGACLHFDEDLAGAQYEFEEEADPFYIDVSLGHVQQSPTVDGRLPGHLDMVDVVAEATLQDAAPDEDHGDSDGDQARDELLCELVGGEVSLTEDGVWSCCKEDYCTVCEHGECTIQCRTEECCERHIDAECNLMTESPVALNDQQIEEVDDSPEPEESEPLRPRRRRGRGRR